MNAMIALAKISDMHIRALHADAVHGRAATLALVGPDSGPEADVWYEAACAVVKVYSAEIFRRHIVRAEAAVAT